MINNSRHFADRHRGRTLGSTALPHSAEDTTDIMIAKPARDLGLVSLSTVFALLAA